MTESLSRYERRTINAVATFLTRAVALAIALPLFGNTITVMNTNDSGSGSLRQAIADASPGDTIAFQLPNPSVITLSNFLWIRTNLSIQGPGPTQLAIRGNQQVQVFLIDQHVTVSISGLTIENGSNRAGGGISNFGTLTVTNCTITHNLATTQGVGGGIFNSSAGTLTVIDSTISDNTVYAGHGGGIWNGGTLTLLNSTVSGSNYGEGIMNVAADPSSPPKLTVINSTISGNEGGISGGGGVGPVTLTNSTIAGNRYFGILSLGGVLTAKGLLLAGNQGESCQSNGMANTGYVSQGYNLSDDNSCSGLFTAATDKNGTPPGLASITAQNNGGPTQTFALLPTSPAVDAIPVANCTDAQGNPLTSDQRGIKRPQGAGCDIGAFELVQNTPFSTFSARLAILTGKSPGFGLTVWFSLGSGSNGIRPLTEDVTLQVANYTVTIPAGSMHQLVNSPRASYAYTGTISGTTLVAGLVSLGNNNYQIDIAGSPVAFASGLTNPVTVSLSIGDDTGSAPVTAVISAR